jgi:hypothetical protein
MSWQKCGITWRERNGGKRNRPGNGLIIAKAISFPGSYSNSNYVINIYLYQREKLNHANLG